MMFHLHVHAVNTTGLHSHERKNFKYASKCSQCGTVLSEQTHVASHVLTYSCILLNCCFPYMSLQTCCRSCNSKHTKKDSGKCCVKSARFITFSNKGKRLNSEFTSYPCCYTFDAGGIPPVDNLE